MSISPFNRFHAIPVKSALYDPKFERDSCGFALVATTKKTASHEVIEIALESLRNLEHRGSIGSDAGTGDGAGILMQIPDEFFRSVVDFELPIVGKYAVGHAFLSLDQDERTLEKQKLAEIAAQEGLQILGWRSVPTDETQLGKVALQVRPEIEQLFVSDVSGVATGIQLDRLTFRFRKRAEREHGLYFASLSSRTIVFKGMVTTLQLQPFYPDLSDSRMKSMLAIVHSRFSTNTFPSWPLAQPFRFLAHNGEINTIGANRNWMKARESQLKSDLLGELNSLYPILTPGGSDSASLDEVVELLELSGRTLPHAIAMLVPEAWENDPTMSDALKDFYRFHSAMMEPWDGPAALAFSDGTTAGATLDRNGLRPGRYLVTDDGLFVLASETGVFNVDAKRVLRKGKLQPGKMLLVDTEVGRIIENDEIKDSLAKLEPWGEWVSENEIVLDELPWREHVVHTAPSVRRRQRTFGYTHEEVRLIVSPMAKTGQEPIGAMGTDTPIAVLSDRPRLLFDYFAQQFAQVTNPPLDSIREESVTSLQVGLGPERNLLEPTPAHARQVNLDFPVLDNDELAKIEHFEIDGRKATYKVRGLYEVNGGAFALEQRLDEICNEVESALNSGSMFVILSDRDSDAEFAPIPTLLMLAAVNRRLVDSGKRLQSSLIVEAGDVREVHHVATLIGFGAFAVNPYLAMETAELLSRKGRLDGVEPERAVANIIYALGKGVLKTMSKMGISTVSSYAGSQAFEAVGLSADFVSKYFPGVTTTIGGVGLETIAEENRMRHSLAYGDNGNPHSALIGGGEYQWRREGPPHLFNPETVFLLQHATRSKRFDIFKNYAQSVDSQVRSLKTIRGLFDFLSKRKPIPIDEVEPISSIIERFATGAMSYGAISKEMHETLAVATNRIGAKSNTGEGGESVERLTDPTKSSAIKQVASGRFGVTSLYLSNASDLQIKLAQGAKPGEGGQLPANKVYPEIAKNRMGTPGVGLISPPPHHDIYSIEDLKQLIFDLKRANRDARVNVKLVSEAGVGTVAAGVAKAKADVILISGHDGGTGASPFSSLKHAGTPWEIGLAEAHQTLVANGLRNRVALQADGHIMTGRDVLIAALLGAEEFGFATAPMVVSGCILMRVCHLDTCPVGVATQNPELRKRFTGTPEFVETYFEFVAMQVRELLAELGYKSLGEVVGHSELLSVNETRHNWKSSQLDLGAVLRGTADSIALGSESQDHELTAQIDFQFLEKAKQAFESGNPVKISASIRNTDRAIGTLLGNELTKRFGAAGLQDDSIEIALEGSAGQSLGAFIPKGITIRLSGDANDFVGKGISGGRIILNQPAKAEFRSDRNIVAGNVVGYGATSGEIFISGLVGERFCVRNSGATVVAEGTGDHALEYMTGGVAVILGATGKNLAAGMSGGMAFVRNLDVERLNKESRSEEHMTVSTPNGENLDLLKGILARFAVETDSALAKEILFDWQNASTTFSLLLPTKYAAVKTVLRNAELNNADVESEAVWQQILEVTGG